MIIVRCLMHASDARRGEIIVCWGVMVPSAHIDRGRLDAIVQNVCRSATELTQMMRYVN
ncbi:hypothetical protein [Pseudomonas typographi]|uniref:IclR-ED domain-containing protein n=1 Tax=Pseudomonas typographi TaxID=2715964 RepID=A0ABR7YY75_9PSED|nr:hypothetical protein [Pseudomonas typographi]MBD1550376.1 hypothetical protein [Pseudomonas typographi]MBD1588879.1 hypothetical protein [Pseudomonas typographi]MBD1598157.1 hypothetical protein [Pseudomonas typographi]